MKLSDILPTDISRAATAKLGNQVQKGSVAAGKQPKLHLGVIGMEIGQTQSTGDTSRVVGGTAMGGTKPTPMMRRQLDKVPFKKP